MRPLFLNARCPLERRCEGLESHQHTLCERVQELGGHIPASVIERNRERFEAGDPLQSGTRVFLAAPSACGSPIDPGLHVVLWSEANAREGDYMLVNALADAERWPSPLGRAPRWALRREQAHPLWRIVDRAARSRTIRALLLHPVRQQVEAFVGPSAPSSFFAEAETS